MIMCLAWLSNIIVEQLYALEGNARSWLNDYMPWWEMQNYDYKVMVDCICW